MEIRKAKQDDFDKYSTIKEEFLKEYSLSSQSKEFIYKEFLEFLKSAIFIAIEKEEIVGYISGEIENNEYWKVGYISEIFITNSWKGKGISTKLKDAFLDFLKTKGITTCKIDVNPNNPAKNIYEKWGFKVDKYRMSLKF
jgi:ribosomal protein S18 acetylase RimI-like enzyme